MSDHEFEQRVRQKLDDLRLHPSATSWENIENRLRTAKRRREPLIWLPALLLVIGLGTYLLLGRQDSDTDDRELTAQQKVQKQQPAPGVDKPAVAGNDEPAMDNAAASPAENKPEIPSSPKINPSTQNFTQSNQAPLQKTDSLKQNKITEPAIAGKYPAADDAPHVNNEKKAISGISSDPDISDKTAGKVNSLNNLRSSRSVNYYSRMQKAGLSGSLEKPLKTSQFNMQQNINVEVPAATTAAITSVNKWSFGVQASAGLSAVNEGNFLNFEKAQVEDVAYRAAFVSNAFAPSYTPSEINPGLTFSAGAFVKRQLNKRLSISTGINYLQINTRNKVGNQVNDTQLVNNGTRGYRFVSNYFLLEQDRPTEYKNRYHFIEVPVALHTLLNPSGKIPVYWNAGMSVSRLISSNSLHFDGTTGVYYKDDKLINRTQLAVTTGFSVALLNKTRVPVWVGPSARYNVSRILQKDVSTDKNFMSLGLDVRFLLR